MTNPSAVRCCPPTPASAHSQLQSSHHARCIRDAAWCPRARRTSAGPTQREDQAGTHVYLCLALVQEEQTTDKLLAKMHEGAKSAEAAGVEVKGEGVEAAADSALGTRPEAAATSLLKLAAAQLTEERARARRATHENRILNTILTGRPSGSQHTQLISRIVDEAEHLRILRYGPLILNPVRC